MNKIKYPKSPTPMLKKNSVEKSFCVLLGLQIKACENPQSINTLTLHIKMDTSLLLHRHQGLIDVLI